MTAILPQLIRALIDAALRLIAVFALYRAGKRARKAEDLARMAAARKAESEALLAAPRTRDELVRRLRERGL